MAPESLVISLPINGLSGAVTQSLSKAQRRTIKGNVTGLFKGMGMLVQRALDIAHEALYVAADLGLYTMAVLEQPHDFVEPPWGNRNPMVLNDFDTDPARWHLPYAVGTTLQLRPLAVIGTGGDVCGNTRVIHYATDSGPLPLRDAGVEGSASTSYVDPCTGSLFEQSLQTVIRGHCAEAGPLKRIDDGGRSVRPRESQELAQQLEIGSRRDVEDWIQWASNLDQKWAAHQRMVIQNHIQPHLEALIALFVDRVFAARSQNNRTVIADLAVAFMDPSMILRFPLAQSMPFEATHPFWQFAALRIHEAHRAPIGLDLVAQWQTCILPLYRLLDWSLSWPAKEGMRIPDSNEAIRAVERIFRVPPNFVKAGTAKALRDATEHYRCSWKSLSKTSSIARRLFTVLRYASLEHRRESLLQNKGQLPIDYKGLNLLWRQKDYVPSRYALDETDILRLLAWPMETPRPGTGDVHFKVRLHDKSGKRIEMAEAMRGWQESQEVRIFYARQVVSALFGGMIAKRRAIGAGFRTYRRRFMDVPVTGIRILSDRQSLLLQLTLASTPEVEVPATSTS